MKNIFGDIFKAILLGLNISPPPYLIDLMATYLEVCFETSKKDSIDSVLRITVHFIKNIDNTPENMIFFQRIFVKFSAIAPKIAQIVEEETTEYFLQIIEEFMLIGVSFTSFDLNAYLVALQNRLSEENLMPLPTCFKLKTG